MFQFTDEPIQDYVINVPVYTDQASRKYSSLVPDYIDCTEESADSVCTNIGYAKYKDWIMPNARRIRMAIIDTNYFPSWANKSKMDENGMTTHFEYAQHLSQKQADHMWKHYKFTTPVSVCCIPVQFTAETAENSTLSVKALKRIQRVFDRIKTAGNIVFKVSDKIVSSTDLYSNLDKYKEEAYNAFKLFPLKSSVEHRIKKYVPDAGKVFSCIPVYVKPQNGCVFDVDLFYSLESEILSFDYSAVDTVLKKCKLPIKTIWDYLVPVDSIPELGEVLYMLNNEESEIRKKIELLADRIVSFKNPFYVDLKPLGGATIFGSMQYSYGKSADRFKSLMVKGVIDMLSAGGGYICLAVDQKDRGVVQACGVAIDCLNGVSVVPPDFLQKNYRIDYQNRDFSTTNVDYIELKK